jgi:predicted Zn finger-like uncharacterized protein
MNLITQCPHCSTAFKVVRDQLKVSQGWVRCGQCDEVFDSSPQLREWASDEAPQPVAAQAPVAERPAANPPAAQALGVPVSAAAPAPAPPASAPAPAPAPAPASVSPTPVRAKTASATTSTGSDFSFISNAKAQTQRAASPRGRAATWAGAFVLMLLACGLLGQVVYHERDRLAAVDLRARDALQQACAALGCDIKAFRQIESISVESSSFNKTKGDAYLLSFVVTNSADIQLAKPAIELTLTDSQDLPVLRRVLLPQDLDPQGGLLSPHGEWVGRHGLSLSSVGADAESRIAGYRLLAFYP